MIRVPSSPVVPKPIEQYASFSYFSYKSISHNTLKLKKEEKEEEGKKKLFSFLCFCYKFVVNYRKNWKVEILGKVRNGRGIGGGETAVRVLKI